jgi:hypothetical protein
MANEDNLIRYGRYRKLYESFIFGKRINALSWPAEAFYWRVYSIADDYGNFPADPFILIPRAGGLRTLTDVEVTDWIKEMELNRLIRLYLVDASDWYGHILSFASMQSPTGPPRGGRLGLKRRWPESPWDNDIPLSERPRYTSSAGGPTSLPDQVAYIHQDQDDLPKEQEDHNACKGTGRKRFVLECFEYWQKKLHHPNAKLSPERVRALEARYKDSSVNEVKLAIDGCESSDFHMGRQPNNPDKYDDITLICRNRSKVEWFGDKVKSRKKEPEDKKQRSEEARRRWSGKG